MAAVVLLCVLVATTCLGLVWRYRNGRVRTTGKGRTGGPEDSADLVDAGDPAGTDGSPEPVDPVVLRALGVHPAEAPVTLVQFSSAFCQPCRATRQVLGQVTALLPEVAHVEVDAESHLSAVRALKVSRTPTVLLLDRRGRLVGRASGLPRKVDVIAAVAPLLDR
ncbi:MAG TPA: thioredoxin family protein [Mycobacteriales bacterium]|nr:thioredoxin family protein [Mycobacteriales bacterium]